MRRRSNRCWRQARPQRAIWVTCDDGMVELMEHWELAAREAIRDLVARYNANGDAGRFAPVVELFAPDAVMDVGDGGTYTGHAEILTIFTGARDRAGATGGERWHVR